jgi:hypothetical protein
MMGSRVEREAGLEPRGGDPRTLPDQGSTQDPTATPDLPEPGGASEVNEPPGSADDPFRLVRPVRTDPVGLNQSAVWPLGGGDEPQFVGAFLDRGVRLAVRILVPFVPGVQGLPELGVTAHAVAVAADVDDVAVVQEAVDQGGGHDVVAEDLAPLLEALVGGEDGGGVLVAAGHELEEEHGAVAGDGQVADLVDNEDGRVGQGLETLAEVPGGLGLLEEVMRSARVP